MGQSKHERHIRDARAVAEKLTPFERDVVLRLCRSSEMSMATNRRANREYRDLLKQIKEKST